jgi:hypothetical protein
MDNNSQETVSNEVIEGQETTPEVISEETIDNPESTQDFDPDNPNITEEEGKETGEETEKGEEEEFNPDEIDFSENDTTFGKYDLSKYKDVIDFENAEALEAFRQEAAKLEQLGASQELVEYICESVLGLNEESQSPQKMTKTEVEANLKQHLTIEERRNYPVVNNYVKDILKGTELENNTLEIMSNPYLVKLASYFYKKSVGGRVINQSNVPEQKPKATYTLDTVQRNYEKFLEKNPTKEQESKYLSDLYKKIPDKEKEQFSFIYEGLFTK